MQAKQSGEILTMPRKRRTVSRSQTAKQNHRRNSLLRGIGIVGLRDLEPVILAALVTEEPLLLIGAHGTGKSLLLTRISEALGLEFRHYNASLLNFDDLVGFPLPTPGGSLEYIKTPAAIWGAETVIFDEISRCRPDMQNKLFPVVHERRIQGILLESLRYRWAAMNPPVSEEDENGYVGSEPLDPALADRFAFVVVMPGWELYDEEEQVAVRGVAEMNIPPGPHINPGLFIRRGSLWNINVVAPTGIRETFRRFPMTHSRPPCSWIASRKKEEVCLQNRTRVCPIVFHGENAAAASSSHSLCSLGHLTQSSTATYRQR